MEVGNQELDWTDIDASLWWAAEIIAGFEVGALAPMTTPFAPMDPGDPPRVCSDCEVSLWTAVGDGSYSSSYFVAGGLGMGGLMTLAATAGASALYNRHKRNKALGDMQPRWVPQGTGLLWLSYGGFQTQLNGYLGGFDWFEVLQATMVAPHTTQLLVHSAEGTQENLMLRTALGEAVVWLWSRERGVNLGPLDIFPRDLFTKAQRAGYATGDVARTLALPGGVDSGHCQCCGAELRPAVKFCGACGSPVDVQ